MSSLHTTHGSARRGYSHRQTSTRETIKRGILTAFNPATYTANVLIMEATSAYLQGVPVACHLDGTSAQINALCAVLFFDEQNYTDAVVLAVYPNGSQGIPNPAPGRIVFVSGYQQISGAVINSGTTSTFTIWGNGGIPAGALGIIFSANFTSPSSGSYIQIGPHGTSLSNYQALGNLPAANSFLNTNGIVQLDSSGKIDIKANSGNCTVSLYTQGYIQ
jgi:hypothetical protein